MARVLVTGASRGLGRALALDLARRGHAVVAGARRTSDLAGLNVAGTVALDVSDPASVDAAVAAAGEVDVVINNAAVSARGPVEAIPLDAVRSMFDVNVLGTLRVIQAFLPGMRARGHGLIVNISSGAAQSAPPWQGTYAATKAVVATLSDALREEVQEFEVLRIDDTVYQGTRDPLPQALFCTLRRRVDNHGLGQRSQPRRRRA